MAQINVNELMHDPDFTDQIMNELEKQKDI